MKIELFLDEDVHSRTLGDHCFKTTPIQRNDVKIVTPASAYCQRNNEESFGVLVDYWFYPDRSCHTMKIRPVNYRVLTKIFEFVIKNIQQIM